MKLLIFITNFYYKIGHYYNKSKYFFTNIAYFADKFIVEFYLRKMRPEYLNIINTTILLRNVSIATTNKLLAAQLISVYDLILLSCIYTPASLNYFNLCSSSMKESLLVYALHFMSVKEINKKITKIKENSIIFEYNEDYVNNFEYLTTNTDDVSYVLKMIRDKSSEDLENIEKRKPKTFFGQTIPE